MWRLHETFAGLAADALSGRIGSDQFGMFRLDFLQLNHELVELGVGNLGIVEDVVEIFVVADFFPEGVDLLFDPFGGGGHDWEIIFGKTAKTT